MVRSTSQAARFGARGCDTDQHDCDVWWYRSPKVVQVLDFPAGIVGVNGVMRFLVLEEPMSADGRQQFIPPLTPITIMRQLGATVRMKESGDVLEIEDDRGTIHTEKLVRERSGHVHNQLDFFSREGWKLPDSLRAQLKHDPFIASNRHEKCSYGKYEFKDEKQMKLAATAECYGLDALETVKTSTGETSRNDELPEDLWPNLNAMTTRLQQLYIGSHEEKLTAREHGFDRDFWAGSPSDRTTKLYRVHVKPTKIVHVRSAIVRDVSRSSWCGNFVTQDLPFEKHGVAVLHSSSTTLTMTRTFGQALLKGPSG